MNQREVCVSQGESLKARAEAQLRSNDRDRYTVPSSRLYPHQWAWDSAFAAIGWLHIDPQRALLELTTLFEGQWDDGRVPHIQFHILTGDYFPGPDSWGTERTSTISNPPVWMLALERIFECGHGHEQIRAMMPALERSVTFFHQQRDPLDWGVICTAHPWENGLDNCPAWDAALEAINPEDAPQFTRVDKERVEDPEQRPTDDQYKRYMAVVESITRAGFGLGDFAVYDPFLTTLVVRAEGVLGRFAQHFGMEDVAQRAAQRAQKLRQGLVQRLWSQELGRYRFYDARGKSWISPDALPAYSPLMLGDQIEGYAQMKATLKADFWATWPLPTVNPSSDLFEPERYWRGPAWINMNWLFAPELGSELVDKTLELLQKVGFWEYFNPHTGRGLGTDGFAWSAALGLDLMVRREEGSS